MDWGARAGRTLVVGFEGSRPSVDRAAILARVKPAGVILFRRNLESPAALLDLLAEVAEALPQSPIVAVDQEGGRVSRLEPWLGPTPSAERWSRQSVSSLHRHGAALGQALRTLLYLFERDAAAKTLRSG